MLEALPLDQYSIRFTPDELRERERAELVAHAKAEFANLPGNMRAAMSSGFGTNVRSSAKSTRAIICVPSQIHATIDEVADVFFSDRTNAAIGFAQSQEIYRLLSPSANHPLRACGLRWSLWHSPSKLLRQRDICYLEYMDTFIDEHGRRGWARCTQSIRHRSCPSLLHSHGVVRAHLECSGTIYTESTTTVGVLDVLTLYDADTKGLPAWMTKFVASRKAKNAHLLEHLIRLQRAASDSLVADFTKPIDLPSSSAQTTPADKVCIGCSDALPKWSVSSRKCRECSESLCKSCGDIVYCALEGGKKLNRICMHCVDPYLVDPQDAGSSGSNSSSSKSSRSDVQSFRLNRHHSKSNGIDMYVDSSENGSTTSSVRSDSLTSGSNSRQQRPHEHHVAATALRKQSSSSMSSMRTASTDRSTRSTLQSHRAAVSPPDSPLPMLEDSRRGEKLVAAPPLPPSASHPRAHHRQMDAPSTTTRDRRAATGPRPQQQQPRQHVTVQAALREPPQLVNLGVSRYKASKSTSGNSSSSDIDLSYLSTFKTVRASSQS